VKNAFVALSGPAFLGFATGLDGLSQKEVSEDKLPFPFGKRIIANGTCYFAIVGFWSGLKFDQFVKRAAVRACKEIERRWIASRHMPPERDYARRLSFLATSRNCHAQLSPKRAVF
jgi:hypothetical protein